MPAGSTKRKAQPTETPRRFRVRIEYVLLLAFMAFFAYKFVERTQQIKRLAVQEAALRQQNARISADNARMQHAIKSYSSPDYVEGEARALLGYTKPGDTAIQTRPIHQAVVTVRPAPARPLGPPEPSWKLWWQSFFG